MDMKKQNNRFKEFKNTISIVDTKNDICYEVKIGRYKYSKYYRNYIAKVKFINITYEELNNICEFHSSDGCENLKVYELGHRLDKLYVGFDNDDEGKTFAFIEKTT